VGEEDLFAEAMRKVKPLAGNARTEKRNNLPKRPRIASIRHANHTPDNTAHPASATLRTTDEPWVLVADGVSRERLRRLASGRPAAESRIDLHGMNRDEAIAALLQQLGSAIASGMRTLCIIHGRGLHSQGRPVLKDAVYRWLREGPFAHNILAVIPQPGSGGGACLLLLRRRS